MNNYLFNQNTQNRKGNYLIEKHYSPQNSQQSYMKNNLNNIQQGYQYQRNNLHNDNIQHDYQYQRNEFEFNNFNIKKGYHYPYKEFDNNNNQQGYQYQQQNEFDNNNNNQQGYQYQQQNEFDDNNFNIKKENQYPYNEYNNNNNQQEYQYPYNEYNNNNNNNQQGYQYQYNEFDNNNNNHQQEDQYQYNELDNNNNKKGNYYPYNEFDNNNNYKIQQTYQYQRNDLNHNKIQQRYQYQRNDFEHDNLNKNDSINNNIYSSNSINQNKQNTISSNNFKEIIITNPNSPFYNNNNSNSRNNQNIYNPINLKKNYNSGNVNIINDNYIRKINIEQQKNYNNLNYIQEQEMNMNKINQVRNLNNENILIYQNKINPKQKKIKFSNEYYYYTKNVPLKIEEHLQTVRSESSSCNNSISGVSLIETTNEKLQSIKYTSQSFVIKKDSNNILERRNISLSKNPMRMKGDFEDLIETIPNNNFNKNQRIQITNAQYPINHIINNEINIENIEFENEKKVRNYIMEKIVEKGDNDIYSNRYKIPNKKNKHKKTFSISFPIKPNNSTKFGIYNILGERNKNDSDKFELIHEGKYLISSHSAQDINIKKSISPKSNNKNIIEYKPMKITYKLKELNSSQFYHFSSRSDEKLIQEKNESLELIKRPFIYSILKKSINKDRKNYFYTKKNFSTRTFSQSPQNNNLLLNLNK